MLRQTSPPSSERYVSLDLLSYLESGQTMPFHIFADVVMPDFRHHLSKFQPHSERDCLHGMFEEIGKDLYYIKEACGKVKQWEDLVNNEIKELIIQCFDDAFKDGTEALETPRRTNFLQDKLEKTQNVVSKLRTQIFSLPELSSVNLDSGSFKRSSFSMRDDRPVEQRDQNMIQFQAVYNRLKPGPKKCLLCFSVFPENAVIKKKVLVHWWVGEGFIDSPSSEGKTAEETGNEFFRDFISKGIIEPVNKKKRRPSSENCKMEPSIRDAVIELAKADRFFCFDTEGNPTANSCDSRRACLVKTEKGSSLRQFNYSFHLKKDEVHTLFNVNEPHLDFKVDFFLKMKCVKVLQLGRWEASAKQLVEVEDAGFLKGLKNMKDLRYFSLRGISRITEIPDSICRLSNLRILNLNGCQNLEKLPDGIGSLKMLTHLDMSECYLISHMPKGLALLSQLQVLKGFVIRKPRRGGHYCKLVDLAKLENLRKLGIHVDRTHAESEEELRSLREFRSLRSLSVAWSQIYNSSTPRNEAAIQRIVSLRPKLIKKISSLRSTPDPTTPASTSPPPLASLAKLGLQYFPGPKMPDWLGRLDLQNLKKLYVRGGNLSDLRSEVYHPETVEALRLKYLPELQMNWRGLQALFPKLTYLEKVECPKLSLFPCDENGEWISEANEVRGNSDNVTLATISENVSDQKKAHISKSISTFEFKSHNHRVIKRSSSSKV
jgi:Leucine-rich repeat (LRR) protein